MRALVLGTTCAIALAAVPAMAQSGSQSDQSGQAAKPTGSQPQTPKIQAMSQDKLRSDLKNAGFSNITVLDPAYLGQADASDGNKVLMFINPPSVPTGNQASNSSSTSGSNDTKQQQQSSSSN